LFLSAIVDALDMIQMAMDWLRTIGLLQAGQKSGLCKLIYNMDCYAFYSAEWLERQQKRPTAQKSIKIKVKMNQAKK